MTHPTKINLCESGPGAIGSWFDKSRIAKHYQVSVRTVDNWMRTGVIPFVKIGGVVRFDPAKVAAALAKFEINCR
jgi:predicted site-specific integrase-resolvase